MKTSTDINNQINSLPKPALDELSQFLEFLNFKYQKSEDWAENLSNEAKSAIQKGWEDIENGKVIPHSEAREMMSKYLKEKTS